MPHLKTCVVHIILEAALFFPGMQLADVVCVICWKKTAATSSSGYKKLQKVVTCDGAYKLKESVIKSSDDKWMVVQLKNLSET